LRKIIIIVAIVLSGIVAKVYYDTNSIEVLKYQIRGSSLGEVLSGKKVAFLTDLHIKNINLREKKVLDILKEEKPDLIFLGGDFINFGDSFKPVISFFQELKAAHGIYGVMGNTEYSHENASCILCHKEQSKHLKENPNPRILRNSSIYLKLNGKILNIIGLDDPVTKKGDFKKNIQGLNSEHPSILLAHSPEVFTEVAQSGINFLLCGHTHGGQIFLLKYPRKFLLFGPALEYLEGFYGEGKTLMYVSRGVGTSFLPFRLGVKPEITFFTFLNDLEILRESFNITKSSAKIEFVGLNFSSFFDLFNFYPLNYFGKILKYGLQHPEIDTPKDPCTLRSEPYVSNAPYACSLFDFESEADLERLNWECHKWFEITSKNATSGKYSLKVSFPRGLYPGINFEGINTDWGKYQYFKLDIFNPSVDKYIFQIRIDDKQSGLDYAHRYDKKLEIKQGMNHIVIPTDSIKTNIQPRPLDLKSINRFKVFIPNNPLRRELYIDNIRLE